MKLSSLPIQQQIYTRERRGLFRSTEGFDTVAKSEGLDASFIKKTLHPFCAYDAPTELTTRGEKDGALYPEALHLFHTESGETVLGRSVYQPADFTGLRSAFLTHNYVIPTNRSGEVVSDYRAWFGAIFSKEYDIASGSELPELHELPHPNLAESTVMSTWRALLDELRIDEQIFKQLLLAVMTSCGEGRKKVYVSLDVPPEQIDEQACRLLELLYAVLPYEFRRRLGFITYAKEPQSRKYVHLQFVERGSLRVTDRSLDKEYTFDLATGRSTQIDLDGRQPYLDFVWHHLEQQISLEPFLEFADEMLKGMGVRKTAVSSYHELAILYQIEQGNYRLFEVDKANVLSGLLEFLKPEGALDTKERLNDVLMGLFDREFDEVRQGMLPDQGVAKCFRDYFHIITTNGVDGSEKVKIITYFIRAVNNTLAHQRKDLATSLYELIEGSPGLKADFFDTVLKNEGLARMLFEPYIQEKFLSLQKSKNVLNLVQSWATSHPEVLYNGPFQESAQIALGRKLRDEPSLLPAVNGVLEGISKLEKESQQLGNGRAFAASAILEQLRATTLRVLLSEIDLERLTREQLLTADFLKQGKGLELGKDQTEQRLRSNAMVLSSAYQWFTEPKPDEAIFNGLSLQEIDTVQQLGRKWLQSEITANQFNKLALVYYNETETGFVEYSALLDYLRKNATDKETIYEFLLWSQGHPYFARPRGLVPAYSAAILAYFKKHDRNAFKSRDYRNRYFSKSSAALEQVFDKARFELSSPLVQFISRNQKKLIISSSVVLLAVVVILGCLLTLQKIGVFDRGTEAAPPDISSGGIGSNVLETVIVYAEQIAVGSAADDEPVDHEKNKVPDGDTADLNNKQSVDPSEKPQKTNNVDDNQTDPNTPDDGSVSEIGVPEEMTQLVFLFQEESMSRTFDPSTLYVEIPGQEKQQFVLMDVGPGNVVDSGQAEYPWKVVVPLGQKLYIPTGSMVTVQDKRYAISEWKVSQSGALSTDDDTPLGSETPDPNTTDPNATNSQTNNNKK
ncbi:GAP1-N2 domain-containing protein [Paenibacillus segetis]|uniref:Glycosyltransferase n=1 Tax=Paenibacillus segetis TaxID=1325360 RepID=A0ABQ1YFQ0_9BACL|nr:glycosyltransferase [Paenibacillus segetis]GGH22990.1 hypothetical protein GCM10008013_21770 [Paenibacillus segetis]